MADTILTVADGLVVSLDYTLRVEDDDEIVDSSEGHEPLQFMQGQGQIVPGLEQQLYGMGVGEGKNVVVAPADGYGEIDPEAFQLFPLDDFPSDLIIEPGMGLQLSDTSGQVFEAYVAEVTPDGVLLNFNHPLAGKTLHFDVKIASLRLATDEEQSHGHVHSHEHEH